MSDLEWFGLHPFRQFRIRPAIAGVEFQDTPPAKSMVMAIAPRWGRAHIFHAREPFNVPTTDIGISSLLSGLTAPVSPREPRGHGGKAPPRSKVAA